MTCGQCCLRSPIGKLRQGPPFSSSGVNMFIANDAPDTKENRTWRRGEMAISFIFVCSVILYGLQDAISLSEELKPRVVGLRPTFWSDSSRADLNDGQWSSFRGNLGIIIVAAVFQVLLCKWAQAYGPRYRLKVSLAYGVGFAAYLHGSGLLFFVAMVLVNYSIAQSLRGNRVLPFVAWIGNLGFLVMTEYYGGYKFEDLGFPLLDAIPKVMSWHRVSNLCMLKIVSFMMDWHWCGRPDEARSVRPN